MKKLVREKLYESEKETTLVCTNPGRIHIISGDEARSADVKNGDLFKVGDSPNKNYYFGKLTLQGNYKHTREAGIQQSTRNWDRARKEPINYPGIVFGVEKRFVDSDAESNFFASFETVK